MTIAGAVAREVAVVDLTADGHRGVKEEAPNLLERHQLLYGCGRESSPRNSGQSEQRIFRDARGQQGERGGRENTLAKEHHMETSGRGETDKEEASKSNDSDSRNPCNPLPSKDTANQYDGRSEIFPAEEGDAAAVSDNVVDLTMEESDDDSGDSDGDGKSDASAANPMKINGGENKEEDADESTGVLSSAASQSDLTGATKEGEEPSEDGNDNLCYFCEDGGDLVLCDYCPKAFHLKCHVPRLPEVPSGQWKCCECRAPQRAIRGRCGECAACRREDCRQCRSCRDMTKHGGPGLRKQACERRRCSYKRYAPPETVATARTASACDGDSGVICRNACC